MESSTITPTTISVEQLIAWKKSEKVKPIDGLNIPHITVPAHLISKKRQTEASDSLPINIRLLFNSLTSDNLAKIKEQLRETIVEKAKTPKMIEEVAEEILSNFLISEQNIGNYMHLLNAISAACVLLNPTPDKGDTSRNVSNTIGNFFLSKCKDMIYVFISDANIRRLSQMDLDDLDQLDEYNREREKINNLIVTICALYSQRNTANLKLNALPVYDLMNTIMLSYTSLRTKMTDLGDPYSSECTDEDEYETCRKMCTLYAEQLYVFMNKKAKDFSKDTTPIKGRDSNGQVLAVIVNRFRNEIVPTITENFLISNCEAIEY